MIWGADRQPNVNLIFGDNILQPQNVVKHMGIKLYNDKSLEKEICAERIGTARSILYCARGLGTNQVPVDSISLSKIYWAIGIPKMTYGLDVCPVTTQSLNDIELAHRHHARIIQEIPNNTPKPAVLATLDGYL